MLCLRMKEPNLELEQVKENISTQLEILNRNIQGLQDRNINLRVDNYNFFKDFVKIYIDNSLSDNLKPIWNIIKNTRFVDKVFKPFFLFKNSLSTIFVICVIYHYVHYYFDVTLYCTIAR